MTLDHVSTPEQRESLYKVKISAMRLTEAKLAALAELSPEEQARRELHQAILEAHQAGHSYRAIAEAAGISHQRVAQLLQKEKK